MPDFHIPNDPQWQWAYDLILVAVGEEYPKADPAALRAMGDELYALSSAILNGMGGTANLGYGLAGSLSGPAMDAFQQYQVGITRNVPAGGNITQALGGSAYDFALDSENTQYNIVIAAFTQVVEIAIALASGFGAAAVPALIKIGQEIVKALIDLFRQRLRHLLMRLTWEAFEEGMEELWQSAAAQVAQISEGNRKSLDYKDLGISFAGGAFIGAGVSGMHMIGGKFFPKINEGLLSREGLSALAETLFEGLFTMMVGGGGFNPWATMSSSVIGGMAHHYATEIGQSYGPGSGAGTPPKIETDSLTTTPSTPPPTSVEGPPAPPPAGSSTEAGSRGVPGDHGAGGSQGAGGRPPDGSGTAGGGTGDQGPGRAGTDDQSAGSQGGADRGAGSQGPGQQGAGSQGPQDQSAGHQGAASPGTGSPDGDASGSSGTGGQNGAGSTPAGDQHGADGSTSNGQGPTTGAPTTGPTTAPTDAPSTGLTTAPTDAAAPHGGGLAGFGGPTSSGGLPGFDTTTPATQPPPATPAPTAPSTGTPTPATPSTGAPSAAAPSTATPSTGTPAPATAATGTPQTNSPPAATPAPGQTEGAGSTPVLPPVREQAGGVSVEVAAVEVAAVSVPPAADLAAGVDAPATPAPAAVPTPSDPVVSAEPAATVLSPVDANATGPQAGPAQPDPSQSSPVQTGPTQTDHPGTGQPVTAEQTPDGSAAPSAAPIAGTPARARTSPQFQQAKANAEPKRLRTERYVPWKDAVVPGAHLLRGEITTIDFTTREFTADGRDHRSFDVHLDLVSENDRISPQELRDFADAVQRTVDEMVNGRYTLPDGRLLHIDLIVDTPPWRDGMTRDWQGDPRRNPPVEVTSETGVSTDQHRWNTGDRLPVMVHEVMHYLGAKEGHRAPEHLFTTVHRPGVMGRDVETLPTSRAQAGTSTGPTGYLTAEDLATIHDVARTAGPVRELPVSQAPHDQAPETYPNPQIPSRAPAQQHAVLSPDRGGLPPRTLPPRFQPVRVAGGRNARFAELTRHTRDVNPGNYRQETADLKNDAAPIGFVVNSMLPADDIDQIPEVVRAVTEGLAPDTRVAFVFGVNTTAELPDPAFREAVARAARLAEGLDFPVAVNGYAVGTKNGKFPYGRTRNQVLRDPDTVAAIQGLAQGGPDGGSKRYPYVSIQDFDRGARTVSDGTHVFDRIDRRTRSAPDATAEQADPPARPMMISGGYRVGDTEDLVRRTRDRLRRRAGDHEARIGDLGTRDDRESRKELAIERQKLAAVREGLRKLDTPAGRDAFVRDFITAVDEDMRSRDRQATVHPMLPYSPEPNLFVDGLLTLGRPEVRFGDAGAEFLLLAETLHQAYGEELAVAHGATSPADLPEDILTTDIQVESQNNRHPDRDLAFMTDFVGAATPTDLSRLAADFAAGNFLPQSHAVPTNVNRQLFYTEGTGFKEYRAELRKPGVAAGKPFAAPTDVPGRSWQQTLSPRQLQQLGAQPHNRLVTTVSLPPPGAGPAPVPGGEFATDPDLDPSRPARTVGLPTSQRLVAAHLVSTSDDSGTIQQEFAAATAMAERGGLGRQPGSLYDAIAAALPGADADSLRIGTLRAGRDAIVLDDAAAMRQQRPYENGHFVKAALAPDPGPRRRETPVDDAERERIGNAHDVVEFAAARGTRVHLTVHDNSGRPPREYPVRGARPLGRLELVRTIDESGRVTYTLHVPPPPAPPSDADSDSEPGGFGLFGDDPDALATFAPAPAVAPGTAAPVAGTVDSGLVFAAPGDRATMSTARRFPDRPDRYHVFGHGEPDAIRVGDARITPAQLATRIRADGARRRGRPVVLIVCDSGTDRQNGFAAQLARELPGTRIIAPSGVVWASPTGHAIVTESARRGPDGEALTPPSENARFVEFEASPTDPGHLTVTALPHILDANTPVGPIDAERTARSVARLAAWARSDATEVAARTQPVLDALAPALGDVTPAHADEDLRFLRDRHEQLTALRAEAGHWADQAARASTDAAAALALPPGPQRDLALADALLRAYPAVTATARRRAALDRITAELDQRGDLPAAVRRRHDAADEATPGADTDPEPPAGLLVETEPADLVPFSPVEPGSDETTTGEAAPAETGAAPATEGDAALPSPEAVREHLPAYLRDSRTLGLAEQVRATENAALGAALLTLDPRLPAEIADAVQADSRHDVDQFLGEGRPYPVTVGGRPAELRVTAVLDWDRLTVDRLHADPHKVTATTKESLTHTLSHNRDRHVEPKVPVTALPGFVGGLGGSVPLAPTTEHSIAHKSTYTSTTTVKVTGLAEVTVPIRFVARLVEPGRPDPAEVEASGTVALAVPTQLRPADATTQAATDQTPSRQDATDQTLSMPVPDRFGVESVRSRPADPEVTFFDQVEAILAEDGMGDLVRIGAPGRPALQKLLSEATFSGNLPAMVVTDPANVHDGWVRSGSLPRAASSGWQRFFPGHSQQVEVRLVARHIEEVEQVGEATHIDTSALAGESTGGATAKRSWGFWGIAGYGLDLPPVTLVIAPRVGATWESGATQKIAERTGAKQTVTGTAPGVRYRVEYGVQVRVLGRAPRMLDGSVEALQWTTRDQLPGTALDPDGLRWHGRHGADRTHFAPASIERGESFGGAYLTRFGDRGLYETIAEAVRSVSGNERFRLASRDEMLLHFDDPKLVDGLSSELQAALSRDADLRKLLSPEELPHLANRIVGPGLRIPLIRTGTFHDYVTVVTIRGELGDLSDGDLLDHEKIDTAAKRRAKSTVTSGRDKSLSAEASLEPRVLGPLGGAALAGLGGPRMAVTWATTDESAITGGQSTESSHGPALDDDGKPTGVRLREFAATLDLTVTARTSVRVNQAGRQLSVGAYGRGVPKVVVTSEQRPRTHRLNVRMLVPETQVSRQRPEPDPSPAPRDEEIAYPPPLSRMTGGPHDLDGCRVESFVGAGRLQEAVRETLRAASSDDIYTFEEGRISTVVADELSPERLTNDPELFSRPLTLSNLWHGRRAADARADVRVRLRPTNPTVLDATEFSRIKRTFASGTARKTRHGRTIEWSISATGTVTVRGAATEHPGHTARPGGAFVLSLTPWKRARGRISERSVSGISKLRVGGRAEPELLVRVDVEAEVVAEARHDSNLLPLGLGPTSPSRRAGKRLTLPGAVVMRMTPAELEWLQERDRTHRHQTDDVLRQLQHREQIETLRAKQDQAARQGLHEAQQRENFKVRWERHQQDGAATGVNAPAHAAQPRFRPGPNRSFGIGGVTNHLDLTDRIPHLRRALAWASSEELAQAILPSTQERSQYDPVRGLASTGFLGAAHLHLAAALNGGRSETIRVEQRFGGSTYQVTLTAEPLGEPSFTGIDLVDELSVTDRSVVGEAQIRTTSRTVAQVALTGRAQGTVTEGAQGDATQTTGHSPATGTVGGGLTGTAGVDNRTTRATERAGRTHEQSLTVSGPVPTYRGNPPDPDRHRQGAARGWRVDPGHPRCHHALGDRGPAAGHVRPGHQGGGRGDHRRRPAAVARGQRLRPAARTGPVRRRGRPGQPARPVRRGPACADRLGRQARRRRHHGPARHPDRHPDQGAAGDAGRRLPTADAARAEARPVPRRPSGRPPEGSACGCHREDRRIGEAERRHRVRADGRPSVGAEGDRTDGHRRRRSPGRRGRGGQTAGPQRGERHHLSGAPAVPDRPGRPGEGRDQGRRHHDRQAHGADRPGGQAHPCAGVRRRVPVRGPFPRQRRQTPARHRDPGTGRVRGPDGRRGGPERHRAGPLPWLARLRARRRRRREEVVDGDGPPRKADRRDEQGTEGRHGGPERLVGRLPGARGGAPASGPRADGCLRAHRRHRRRDGKVVDGGGPRRRADRRNGQGAGSRHGGRKRLVGRLPRARNRGAPAAGLRTG